MAEPLDRAKARAERFRHATEVAEADPGNSVTSYSLLAAAVLSAEDVPGLLAEVERLRTESSEAVWRSRIAREIYEHADRIEREPETRSLGVALAAIVRHVGDEVGKMPEVRGG